MPELRFAITQQQKSITGSQIYGQLTRALAILAVLAEESLTQASFQTLSQPSSGWMTKPAFSVSIDPGIQKAWIIRTSLNHSDIFILMMGTYCSLFKCLNAYSVSSTQCQQARYTANYY